MKLVLYRLKTIFEEILSKHLMLIQIVKYNSWFVTELTKACFIIVFVLVLNTYSRFPILTVPMEQGCH